MAVNHALINIAIIQCMFIPSKKSQVVASNKVHGKLLVQVVCLLKKIVTAPDSKAIRDTEYNSF